MGDNLRREGVISMTENSTLAKILVPIDTSEVAERAIPWARAVAGKTAEVVLLEVIPVATAVRSFGGQVIGSAETIQAGYQQMAEDQLGAAVAKWFSDSDHVSTVVAPGDPAEQILAVAEAQGAGLIVMSSHGRGALGRFVSGSVSDRVVRHAPVPVMIVGPEGDNANAAPVKRIVAPVDDSELSLAALPVASELARTTGVPVEVVHVVVPATDLTMTYPAAAGTLPPLAIDAGYEQLVETGKALVEKAVQHLEDHGIEAHGGVYTGSPTDTILGTLQTGDVVVLSSHQRQGLARWVLGSTSMKLIRNGKAPVVIVTRESIERSSGNA
jgi:nucleotide-binding universal stress UspA family protein